MTPPPPVPKPRARYQRDSLSSSSSLSECENLHTASTNQWTDEAPPPLPTLSGIADIISANIPSLAGVASSIVGPASSAPPPPRSIDSMANSIAADIPSLAWAASSVANQAAATCNPAVPPPTTASANPSAASLESIASSLAINIPSLAGMVNYVAKPVSLTSAQQGNFIPLVMTPATPSCPSPPPPHTAASFACTDVSVFLASLDQTAGAKLPPLEGATQPDDEGLSTSPNTIKGEEPGVAVLACWTNQEEAETDSSNEEEDPPTGADGPTEGDPTSNTDKNHSCRVPPSRPPPPRFAYQSGNLGKPAKQKIPRAATIRVSRKRGGGASSSSQSAVVRASWLDVWKGFRHSVLWATLDGQLMSLWKKRTDRFSELLFHVSSITNVKKQDKGRFSVYFRKKHYDFMAHSDEVQDGWVTSLLASRGQQSPTPPELHGQITIKDPRSRAYAAVWGPSLWVYPNKESFQLGVASFSVALNVASVKSTGKHSFTLITPYKSFSLSVDSSKELSVWLDSLSSSILSALSCCHVALRLWENPFNKVCADCGLANPEWASVNLLLVICHACAGQHRALGSSLSKVRSVKMDSKVWTEPLIQLFVCYGNRLANQVWAPAVVAAEQILPECSEEERSKFIQDKYSRGRYRRVHPLASSPSLMQQRLCEVVCGPDVEETLSLLCSGAKVCQSDLLSPAPIQLAERAEQGLQVELLRLNEYTEIPSYLPQSASRSAGDEEEELHGKLEDDRFLFSLENESAACDVLDMQEVLSVFLKDGPGHDFEVVTLTDQLICATDTKVALLSHLEHILKVILPVGVSEAEVGGASAVSKVCIVEVGGAMKHTEAWLVLWEGGVSVYSASTHSQCALNIKLEMLTSYEMNPTDNNISLLTGDRRVLLRFEEQHSCRSWFSHLQKALANQRAAQPPAANQKAPGQSLYPVMQPAARGSVPPGMERCISHVTHYGLKVEGVYRRCGLASKVNRLVEALVTSPSSAPLERDEQGVLDAASALKQYVRQQDSLVPAEDRQHWAQAAVISDERSRFSAYRRLLQKLPDDNRATLSALFGHFYVVQLFSQVNKMSAQNLALVLVPSLFQTLSQDLLRLTRELIIHHTLLFLTPEEDEEEEITVL
ncbi:arf-GAP with Rho-GAP domain, ANK repeat and PH domain-containing protein 1 [Genypterus blacodes]|uniref:arf-GAP with Rho-GAP domain, ANK repeat and PH domain-containing protein 1 n=1 Tax=Genypterus blacodes TaxID=154954 RepID=UPI003F75A6F0